jgi:hypothetical protein
MVPQQAHLVWLHLSCLKVACRVQYIRVAVVDHALTGRLHALLSVVDEIWLWNVRRTGPEIMLVTLHGFARKLRFELLHVHHFRIFEALHTLMTVVCNILRRLVLDGR